MYGALDISTSGLIAQRTRLEAITANIVNAGTYLDENGENNPFRRRIVTLAPGDSSGGAAGSAGGLRGSKSSGALGVHVETIEADATFDLRYEPDNPYADGRGYVKYPNIQTPFETMNAYEAQRAYEANLVVAEASKTMVAQALRLIA